MLIKNQIDVFWRFKPIELIIAEILEVEKCCFLRFIVVTRSEELSENGRKLMTSLLASWKTAGKLQNNFEVHTSLIFSENP